MTAPASTAAFEDLYRTEYRRLLRKLRRRVGSDEAPDLVQEVFARFLRREALGRVDNPAAYLSRVTRNLLIDRARRKRHDMPIFFPFDDERDAASRADQTRRIEAIDLFRLYRQTIRAMPPKTRRVFMMRRVKRMSYKEIAAGLGISIATVDYHMVRALARCRAVVAAQW
ncbi:sigma-70 family RNA polymerase sigma factor [Sphingopyxis sp. MWB1]|uniref:sigma-70 family RNA polymerase sigma factor n=1 Tax=Sphingopyxis sp. MWB1 TaxID=1537715 RepID=UPI0009DEADDD|nr:sigma-70 family RNA polymerase sigma factor [Sphingopyxis sp. MWB1]